jgi:hypothetical protein
MNKNVLYFLVVIVIVVMIALIGNRYIKYKIPQPADCERVCRMVNMSYVKTDMDTCYCRDLSKCFFVKTNQTKEVVYCKTDSLVGYEYFEEIMGWDR